MERRAYRSGQSYCGRKLRRRDAITSLEMFGQCALVAKACLNCAFGQRQTALEQTASGIEPNVNQIGVRRQPDGALEQSDQLELGEPSHVRELLKAEIFRMVCGAHFDSSP